MAFVGVCHLCGELVSVVSVDDIGASWHAPASWLYLAQEEHKSRKH